MIHTYKNKHKPYATVYQNVCIFRVILFGDLILEYNCN